MIELTSSQMTYLKALGKKDISKLSGEDKLFIEKILSRFRDFQEKTLLTDYEKSRVREIGWKL